MNTAIDMLAYIAPASTGLEYILLKHVSSESESASNERPHKSAKTKGKEDVSATSSGQL